MKSEPSKRLEYGDIPRPRWNVIDVMNLVAPSVIPVPLVFDIDLSWAESLRNRYRDLGHKFTITAILLKAIAIAQREHPETRTIQLPTGKLVTLHEITAGFTVERIVSGTPSVFFGTIKHCDSKPLLEIAKELRAYALEEMHSIPQLELQARFLAFPRWLRKMLLGIAIWLPELRLKAIGATFGVSSIGKWGCKTGSPPCLATTTFGVGEVAPRPVAVHGQVEVRPTVTVTYLFDHRIIDGGPACRFMKDVIDLLQGALEPYIHEELEMLQAAVQGTAAATAT